MTLAAALLLISAHPQTPNAQTAQGPRIEVRATTLERALPEIGAKLGVQMRAAPAIGQELILTSFTSHDAEAFRDQLAKTFSGEWRQDENGVWYFSRSTVLRDAELRASRKARLAKIARGLEKARQANNPDAVFDASAADSLVKDLKAFTALPKPPQDKYDSGYYRKARDLDRRGPSSRVIQRVLQHIPIESLDPGAGTQTRVVYSTRPTKMQEPMKFDIMPEIRRYVQEQNVWAEAASSSGITEDQNGGMYTSLIYRRERADKVPAVAILVIQDRYGSRQVSVKAYDSLGKQVLDESESITAYDEDEAIANQKKAKEDPRKVKIELTPDSKRFAEVFDFNEERRKQKGITPMDATPFMDVVKNDPMSYGATDVAFAIARGENRNLIARLDDSYYYLSYSLAEPETAKTGTVDANILDYFVTSTEENGWTRMVPKDLELSQRVTYNRKDLARAMAIVTQGGRMSVSRQAELSLVTPDNQNEKPLYNLVQIFSKNRSWGSDEFMKLYGLMNEQQRKQAATEAGLPFSQLGDAATAVLTKLAYQSDEWRLQYSPTPELYQTFKDGQDPNQELFWGGYMREPTFSLPNGLGGTGTVKITSDTQDKVKTGPVTMKWGTQEGQIMTADELANSWFQMQNPRRFPWMQDDWSRKNLEALTLVNQEAVSIEVRFNDRITSNSQLTSDVPIEGGPYTMRSLPKSFLDQFNKSLAALEEQYKNQPFPDPSDYQRYGGNGGGGSPPP